PFMGPGRDRRTAMASRRKIVASILGSAAIAVAAFELATATVRADPRDRATFVVDVAVDHSTFAIVPSMGLVLQPEDPGPNRGTPFIVDGKVFPGGTLETGTGIGDPAQPGNIGTWICKGIFTSDLGTDDIGFDTTQMFRFNGDADAIWTEGLEAGLGKIGVITHRTSIGGTRRVPGAAGGRGRERAVTGGHQAPQLR